MVRDMQVVFTSVLKQEMLFKSQCSEKQYLNACTSSESICQFPVEACILGLWSVGFLIQYPNPRTHWWSDWVLG
jgi:hypothetical protein